MQAPAEELLLFSRTIAAILAAANFATAPGPYPPADRQRDAVDDKHLASQHYLAQGRCDEGQPIGELMQPPIEACHVNLAREIARFTQDADRPFLMVLEVFGSDHCDQNNLRVRYLGADITAVRKLLHQ